MTPYIFILLSAIFFCIGIIIDNFLTNKKFKDTKSLLFYSNITNLLFIPLLWIFGLPKALPINLIIPLTIVAIAQTIYLYPYFQALKELDTSIVGALFNFGKIFTPIMAYIVIDERLSLMQYIGFATIIFGAFMMTYQGKLNLNKGFFYMILTTIILSVSATTTKYSLEHIDWITVMTWTAIISTVLNFIIGTLFYRKEILSSKKTYFSTIWQFIINEFVTFLAMACLIYAVTNIQVTISQGILATAPIFMIVFAFFGHKIFPNYFKENIEWKHVIRKVFYILIKIGRAHV